MKSPLRVAIVTHRVGSGDGQGRVNLEIATELLHRGHRVVLVCSEAEAGIAGHPSVEVVTVSPGPLPTELLRNQRFALGTWRWLRAHRAEVDLVLVNGSVTYGPSDVNAVHFVHTTWLASPVHTSRVRGGPYGLYQRAYTALNARWERRALRRTRMAVAVSERVAGELEDLGVPRSRIRVIPNGVDPLEYHPGSTDRERLGLPPDVPLALFAGDLRTPRKNLDTVLAALARVPALHLAVAGSLDGSPYPALAEELGVADRAHFLGFRRDVPSLLQAVDLFVLPSRYEPSGLVVLEAMASGVAVVTASTAGAVELLGTDAGIVVDDPDDVAAVAAALQRLVDEPEVRAAMGAAGRVIAEEHDWRRCGAAYADLLEELA